MPRKKKPPTEEQKAALQSLNSGKWAIDKESKTLYVKGKPMVKFGE